MEKKYWVKNLFLLLTDIACLLLSLVIAYYFRHRYLALFYKDLLFVLCAFDIILFFVMDPYRDFYQRGYFQEFKKTLSYDLVLMSLTFAYMFIIKPENDYSRFTIFLTFIFYFISSFAVRLLIKNYTHSEGVDKKDKNLLVLCKQSEINETIDALKNSRYDDFFYNLCTIDSNTTIKGQGFEVIHRNDLPDYLEKKICNEIYISCKINEVDKFIIDAVSVSGLPVFIKLNEHLSIDGEIPTVNIMGVNLAAINMKWLIEFTKQNIKKLSGKYICVTNVFAAVTASDDPEYCKIQNRAVMAIPDGGPLSYLGRKRGFPNMQRTTGPDYMSEVFKISSEYGYRHYFYGSSQETIDKLKNNLGEKYPDMIIAGMYSPPYRELTFEEDKEIIKMINEADADFVWVGLGAPKQEKWMAAHENKIKGLMVGVGAGFDYFAGNIQRAPMWMQKMNLEWLYRLLQEPKRLFKKYLISNTKFIWRAVIKGK